MNLDKLTKKVVVVGESGVGKSTLINHLARGKYTAHCTATVGAAFLRWTTLNNYSYVDYEIWDTAGQERYRALVPMYLRGAHVILLVYDVTDPDSYQYAITYWLDYIRDHFINHLPPIILIENKIDFHSDRDPFLNTDLIEIKGKCRTSAKTGEGIEQLRELIKTLTADPVIDDPAAEYKVIKKISLPPAKNNNCC